MTKDITEEITANLKRADDSLRAAKELFKKNFYDFSASRSYYSAFYAATSVLLKEGLQFYKHSGVITSVHQMLVKTGKLKVEQGKGLNWLFELRSIGDYGQILHVTKDEAKDAIRTAESFLKAAKGLIEKIN